MLTRHSWLASLLALSAICWHASSHATEFTLDPTRTLVQLDEKLWTIVPRAEAPEKDESASQRRGGAKHKRVR